MTIQPDKVGLIYVKI